MVPRGDVAAPTSVGTLVGNLRDGNASRNVQQSTTKINNQGNLQQKYVSFLEKIACGPTGTKIYNINNGTKEKNKEGTGRPSECGPTEKIGSTTN
jgi:hypothetical protein